jgi:aldehyde dehydrogenase (NAD+)
MDSKPIFDDIKYVHDIQKQNQWRVAQTTVQERKRKLQKLRDAVWAKRAEIHQAIYDDFKKNPVETDITEIFPIISEINHTLRHLAQWMKPTRVKAPRALFGTRSEIHYEPKGLVLILSPWNYPAALLLNPLGAAIAAGNCAIIKPSSKVPHTARFMKSFIADLFPREEVALFEGSSEVSEMLLDLPFDHIFFTGSTQVGKSVMAAAARHLTPVTLELGGKSPAIVDDTANIQKSAERILWGKYINAGQTCVAPDYLLIHEACLGPFIETARKILEARYGHSQPERQANPAYCRLVSEGHCHGLKNLLDQAVATGAKIAFGGASDQAERYMEPTLLTQVRPDSPLMGAEIFGPILPILTFRHLDDAISIIRAQEKPLALYIFSENESNIDFLVKNTRAGGSCINSAIIHLANPNLPFGGVGQSGLGNYHGVFGFRNFSHERAILRQGFIDTLKAFYPPYTDTVKKIIQCCGKYLS